ncbi:serpin family protein [bacterium]|nr:serpin family protein [bacterium]
MTKTFSLIALALTLSISPAYSAGKEGDKNNRCESEVAEDVTNRSPENALNILERAIGKARAQVSNPFLVEIKHKPSGIRSRGLNAGLNPIELQTIVIVLDVDSGKHEERKLINLSLQQVHLGNLKSSDQLADEIVDALMRPGALPIRAVLEDVSDRSPENTKKILEAGISKAKAQNVGKVLNLRDITYEGSGVLARGLDQPKGVNPIEVMNIFALMEDGDHGPTKDLIGKLELQVTHLGDLKSSDEIASEITDMLSTPANQSTAPVAKIDLPKHGILDGQSGRVKKDQGKVEQPARDGKSAGSSVIGPIPGAKIDLAAHSLLDGQSGAVKEQPTLTGVVAYEKLGGSSKSSRSAYVLKTDDGRSVVLSKSGYFAGVLEELEAFKGQRVNVYGTMLSQSNLRYSKIEVAENATNVAVGLDSLAALANMSNAFSAELYSKLRAEDPNKNIIFSGYNIFQMLLLLANGSDEATQIQFIQALDKIMGSSSARPLSGAEAKSKVVGLTRAFKYSMQELQKDLGEGNEIEIGTGLFATEEGFEFSPQDAKMAQEAFEAVVESGATDKSINAYVSEKTRKLIETLFDSTPTPGALVTTLYLKGVWETAFVEAATRDLPFYQTSGTELSKIAMMKQTQDLPFVDEEAFTATSVPFKSGRLVVDVIVPKYDVDQNSWERNNFASSSNLDASSAKLETQLTSVLAQLDAAPKLEVELSVPKFMMADGMEDAMPILREMGMPDFQFSGLPIGQIVHKAVYKQNEVGAEFAAATGAVFESVAMQANEVNANRPFIWILRDTKTGLIIGGPTLVQEPEAYK